MGLLLIGIDEAGYGPRLGPLCVGMAALRVDDWVEGAEAPDLWSRLSGCVCRRAGDRRGRVAVDDSKKLKRPNDAGPARALEHLERGVLAFLHARGARPEDDDGVFESLGAGVAGESAEPDEPPGGAAPPWYHHGPRPVPVGSTPQQAAIAGNGLSLGLAAAGVRVEHLAVSTITEARFNAAVESEGTKAAAARAALTRHLAWARARVGGGAAEERGDAVRVVIDRQGGRIDYAGELARWAPGMEVATLQQTAERCRYRLSEPAGRGARDGGGGHAGTANGRGGSAGMIVQFQPEAESAFLPVALASMLAKYVRELWMARFNAYWGARVAELKPTAGYGEDAGRWLRDVGTRASARERAMLVRRA